MNSIDLYLTIKTVHILSSAILFGTGIGIAFFMFRSLFTSSVHEKLYAANNTVLADYFLRFPQRSFSHYRVRHLFTSPGLIGQAFG